MSLIKMLSVVVLVGLFAFSAVAEDKVEGEKSHNGVTEKMSPEEVKQKIAEKKAEKHAIKKAKKALKADGKFSKEDRQKIKKMKQEQRDKKVDAAVDTPPAKDTQQMIDEADQEADGEDPNVD